MLAVWSVNTVQDELDGESVNDLSLRDALALSSNGDTIEFASSLYSTGPATITLTYDGADAGTVPDQLVVSKNLTIQGPGANLLSIRGGDDSRVF
jgi:hypothetical protein